MFFESRARFALQPAELWTFVADTQRLNRAIGLPEGHFTATPRSDGGSTATGLYERFGFTISRWREHPFTFVKPSRYSVLREYDVGPFVKVEGGAELEPAAEGTELRVFAEIVPRHWLGWLSARLLVGPQSTKRVIARCREYEQAFLKKRAAEGTAGSAPHEEIEALMEVYSGPPPQVDRAHLDQALRRLLEGNGNEVIARRLSQHIATAPDDRAAGMRPFELADVWGTDRHATLVTFLQATSVGMLTMSWDVLCPYCRVPKQEATSLSDFTGQAHCETCNITFDANFDRLVEVRFKPAASIRDVAIGVFCIGGPQNTPHVVAQQELGAGQAIEWALPLETKQYRLRSPQSGAALLEVAEGGDQTAAVSLVAGGVAPPLLKVSAPTRLRVESQLSAPAVVALEEQFWPDNAATAA
ncbi:MAG TPA: DUF5939 domain-containing protein, partial [Chloroflexota bacterium]